MEQGTGWVLASCGVVDRFSILVKEGDTYDSYWFKKRGIDFV